MGNSVSCAPYLCVPGGACSTICNTNADCIDGNVCNDQRACVAPADDAGAKASGGCSMGARDDSTWTLSLAVLGVLGAVARRRRMG
jgi:MYXO-CTERM domain-containing protein